MAEKKKEPTLAEKINFSGKGKSKKRKKKRKSQWKAIGSALGFNMDDDKKKK